ncbi:hypothetical protein IQ07DRAFT_571085 [Pyrenochaeta sp. DS3sAY3a]|nr:hypothetical protein IQ07DRAFT_571085 [Pyrenochaeta sp. DS3sAY3a]
MRVLLYVLVAFAGSFVPLAASQDSPDLAALPSCALPCLLDAASSSSCSLTDFQCLCAAKNIMNSVSDCVAEHCSIRQSLTSISIISTLCNIPVRDRGPTIEAIAAGFAGAALVVVAARLVTRHLFTVGGFGWDDLAIMLPVLALFPITAAQFLMTRNGLGRDIWGVQLDHLDGMLMWFYIAEILYVFIISMTKVSLLLLYLRLFPDRSVKLRTQVLLAFTVIYFLLFTFLTIFQCSPVPHAWRFWDRERPGKCINVNAMVWSMAGLNIAIDIGVLVLPLPELRKLSLPFKKKIYLLLIFGIGFFITIVSIIRLRSLVVFAKSKNFTYDNGSTAYWSLVEINVGLICVSLPVIRPLLKAITPRCFGFGSTHEASSSTPMQGGIHVRTDIARKSQVDADTESDVIQLVDVAPGHATYFR